MIRTIILILTLASSIPLSAQTQPVEFKIERWKFKPGPKTLAELFKECELKIVPDKKNPADLATLVNFPLSFGFISIMDKNILREYSFRDEVPKHIVDILNGLTKNAKIYLENVNVRNPDATATKIKSVLVERVRSSHK